MPNNLLSMLGGWMIIQTFNIRKHEAEVHQILGGIEDLNLVKREANGWSLTREGGKICDEFLNKNLGKFDL